MRRTEQRQGLGMLQLRDVLGCWEAEGESSPRLRRASALERFAEGRMPPPATELNLVERFFNKLKHFRAIAARYKKLASNYLALVNFEAVRTWLRNNGSVTGLMSQAVRVKAGQIHLPLEAL